MVKFWQPQLPVVYHKIETFLFYFYSVDGSKRRGYSSNKINTIEGCKK